jgi:type I restriction enzyme, S subunit
MNERVPVGWLKINVTDLVNVGRGYAFKSSDYCTAGNPIVRVTNISKANSLDLSNKVVYLANDRATEFQSYQLRDDDFLLVMVGATIGKYAKVITKGKSLFLNQNMWRLSVINEQTNSQKFAIYGLQKVIEEFLRTMQGSAREFLTQKEFGKTSISLPPLPEQKKIVSILTSIDEVLEKTQSQIDKLQDLKKGIMNELLTKGIGHTEFKDSELGRIPKSWECIKLGYLVKVTDGAHKTPKYLDTGVPFLRVTDIQSTEINITKTKYISKKEHQELCKRCLPEKGDVLFSKNGTIGITKIINWDWEFSIFVSLALLKIHNKDKVNVAFLDLYLQSPIVRKQIKDRAKQGSVTNLHLEEIRDFDFVIPSTEEQNKIVHIISSIEKKIRTSINKFRQTQSLKKSLMQVLLTGKVRVKVN